jgi:hypothetical protein
VLDLLLAGLAGGPVWEFGRPRCGHPGLAPIDWTIRSCLWVPFVIQQPVEKLDSHFESRFYQERHNEGGIAQGIFGLPYAARTELYRCSEGMRMFGRKRREKMLREHEMQLTLERFERNERAGRDIYARMA